jgi:L-aminopeptidase/D-esterase-like protein
VSTIGPSELVAGVSVGHWTGSGTGVTVVLCPAGTIGSGEVRGGAPATRETALLDPARSVEHVDAVLFTGGSAFGLAAADGAMAWLEEHERGFPTRGGFVPIVPTAAIFDLLTATERPGPLAGRAAIEAAAAGAVITTGRVGAGRGATAGKWRGAEHAVPGGLGVARAQVGEAGVGAIAVVNAVGDVVDEQGHPLAASRAPADAEAFPESEPFAGEATTLVAVATDARCSKAECFLLAQSGHLGLAHAIRPSHTRHDGDLVVALATGVVSANLDRLRVATTRVVAEAVRDAVRQDAARQDAVRQDAVRQDDGS